MNELSKHVSYSSLGTYQECGWKYNLTKIQGIPEKHAVWFTGGSAVHKATEMWDLNPNAAEFVWNDAWYKQVKEDEELHGDMNSWQYIKREDMSWWYGEGLWMLDRWIEFRSNGWGIYKDYIEKQYEVPLVDTVVKMAIDRVMTDYDGNIVLLDIKTGASSQKHPLQLATYAWALRKMEGLEVDKAGFWDARTGHVTTWNLEHLATEQVETIYSEFDRARKAEIYLPNLSNCGRCGVLSYCKFMNGQYTEKEKNNG
jgi:CRISPR/Cas system-associated exonuclease Cas4 (RecB family)